MIKIQGKEINVPIADIKRKLVRTYKGEIERTQTGAISAFPTSFIIPGFDIQFVGTRQEIQTLEQVFLSSDTFQFGVSNEELSISGRFSCTANEVTEMRDKGERHLQLNVSIVSDGSNITDYNGNTFSIRYGAAMAATGLYYGKVYQVPATYRSKKFEGYSLTEGKILITKNVLLTD